MGIYYPLHNHFFNNKNSMNIIDLHQDFMSHQRFQTQWEQSEQTSITQLCKSNVSLFVATAFPLPINDDHYDVSVPALITEELEMYHELADSEDIQLVRTAIDLDSDRLKMLLHLEGLNVFDGSTAAWSQLEQWVAMGVRSVGTHWNLDNQLGAGTLNPAGGLTELGGAVVKFLEQNSLVFDMAHMGRQTFMDAAAIATRPLYVSHGNADVICSNVRNYTDEQLNMIAVSGGVMGVFFANTFVTGKDKKGTVDDVVNHILYIKNLIGIDHIALGSDFGGIVSGTIEDLRSAADFPNLYQALFLRGLSETEIEKIFWQNAERILRIHIK
jgi:membrane dipeptidase